jgi:outer membrane protein assembly factor BamB
LKTGTENWSVNIPYNYVSDFYQDEDNQYVLGVKGIIGGNTLIFAIRTVDGSLLWKKQLGSEHQMVTGTHIVGKVGYVVTNTGIEAFDLESGHVVSSFAVPFTTALQSDYRLVNGKPLFFGMTDSTLIAFKPDGTIHWERPLQMNSNSSRNRQVALLPVYISNNAIYSIDLNTGADNWVQRFDGNVMGSFISDTHLYLQINKQPEVVIYQFDLVSGQQLKALAFNGFDIGSTNLYKTEQPIIFNDWLVFSKSNLSELLANKQPLDGLKSSLHKKSFATEEEIELPSLGDRETLFVDKDFIYLYRDAQMVAIP